MNMLQAWGLQCLHLVRPLAHWRARQSKWFCNACYEPSSAHCRAWRNAHLPMGLFRCLLVQGGCVSSYCSRTC
jgi:hypothetical protein